MIYLDNAATSFPKPECVYRDIDECMRKYCANPGRGGHSMSIAAGMAVTGARDAICQFFNISEPMQLAFTKNATEALNIGIKGILKPGAHVITSGMEHNSVIRPLKTLQKDIGIEISCLEGNGFGEIEPDTFKKAIKSSTMLIVCTLSSNVNGIIMPVDEIGKIAGESGTFFLLDASQGAGSIELDVQRQNIDMLAFPGHKGLMVPQGAGGLYARECIKLKPLMEGGTGSLSDYEYQPEFMPDLLESGTLNMPGIVGMSSGVRYIEGKGVGGVGGYKFSLVKRLIEGVSEIKTIKLYSVAEIKRNSGIVAINMEGLDSTELSYILDREYGIATRAGLHCSPWAHKTLGTTDTGVVRFSVGCFNTADEIDYTVDALTKISEKSCIK